MEQTLSSELLLLASMRQPLSVEGYHALARAGVLGEDDPIELLDGHLIAMSPIGTPHLLTVNRLTFLFTKALYKAEDPTALVSVQNPIRLDDYSEPEPDVTLIRRDAPARTPRPEDIFLVVEVADSTVAYDRTIKRPRYAKAGIPEVWIVLLDERAVEVCRQPSAEGYAEVQRFEAGATLSLSHLPDAPTFAVADFFVV